MKISNFMKMMFLAIAGFVIVSCQQYTADDYVNDMKALTKKTVDSAKNYNAEDWKKVAQEYKTLNEKGAKVLKDMTEEQKAELSQWKDELLESASNYDAQDFKDELKNLKDKTNEFVKDAVNKVKE